VTPLNTGTDPNVKLPKNVFPRRFLPRRFTDSCQISWHFQVYHTSDCLADRPIDLSASWLTFPFTSVIIQQLWSSYTKSMTSTATRDDLGVKAVGSSPFSHLSHPTKG